MTKYRDRLLVIENTSSDSEVRTQIEKYMGRGAGKTGMQPLSAQEEEPRGYSPAPAAPQSANPSPARERQAPPTANRSQPATPYMPSIAAGGGPAHPADTGLPMMPPSQVRTVVASAAARWPEPARAQGQMRPMMPPQGMAMPPEGFGMAGMAGGMAGMGMPGGGMPGGVGMVRRSRRSLYRWCIAGRPLL